MVIKRTLTLIALMSAPALYAADEPPVAADQALTSSAPAEAAAHHDEAKQDALPHQEQLAPTSQAQQGSQQPAAEPVPASTAASTVPGSKQPETPTPATQPAPATTVVPAGQAVTVPLADIFGRAFASQDPLAQAATSIQQSIQVLSDLSHREHVKSHFASASDEFAKLLRLVKGSLEQKVHAAGQHDRDDIAAERQQFEQRLDQAVDDFAKALKDLLTQIT